MKDYRPAKKRVEVTVGESVRILRELQELSQNQLAEVSGIPQATISAIENGRVRLVSSKQRYWPALSSATQGCWCFQVGKHLMKKLPNNAFERAVEHCGAPLRRRSGQRFDGPFRAQSSRRTV